MNAPSKRDRHRNPTAQVVGSGPGFPNPAKVAEATAPPIPLDMLGFVHAALDGLARSAGYPGAAEALIDLTAEPSIDLFGPRDAGVLLADWRDVMYGEDAENWTQRGMGFLSSPASASKPGPNAEYNLTRSKHPLTERIRALRLAGLTNAEQAGVLNRQERTDYWTAARVRSIAHQQGLTRVPMRRHRGTTTPDPAEARQRKNASVRQLRADAKLYRGDHA